MRNRNDLSFTLAKTRCEECGDVFPLWRQQARRKKQGHIKHVFCVRCNAITAHMELAADEVENALENDL